MYKKVSPDMKFIDREKEVLAFWKANDIQKKSIRPEKDGTPNFTLYDGPPTANGKRHVWAHAPRLPLREPSIAEK